MNIVVCIKQVPGTTNVKINPETNSLIREGAEAIVNPFDMYALEQAFKLRDAYGGKVTVLTMGPPQAESALKECVEHGADEIILVSDRKFAVADTWATGWTLANAVLEIGRLNGQVDLVCCGKQAIDGDTAQVGPGIAEYLEWPFVGYVRKVNEVKGGALYCERATDYGHDVLECPLPAVITVLKEIGEPRLPSLKGKMKARTLKPTVWTADALGLDEYDIGLKGSPTFVEKIFSPPPRGGGEILKGEPDEMVSELHRRLKEALIV
jgi:electron transfer flavoprotein beta subunit